MGDKKSKKVKAKELRQKDAKVAKDVQQKLDRQKPRVLQKKRDRLISFAVGMEISPILVCNVVAKALPCKSKAQKTDANNLFIIL